MKVGAIASLAAIVLTVIAGVRVAQGDH